MAAKPPFSVPVRWVGMPDRLLTNSKTALTDINPALARVVITGQPSLATIELAGRLVSYGHFLAMGTGAAAEKTVISVVTWEMAVVFLS